MNDYVTTTSKVATEEVASTSSLDIAARHRILVVDDDPAVAFLTTLILNRAGYETDSVLSAEDAWNRLDQNNVDCVLSDINMAPMDGLELCRKVKADHPALPIILMTGNNISIESGKQCGALAVLRKPFDPKQLLGLLSDLWQKEA